VKKSVSSSILSVALATLFGTLAACSDDGGTSTSQDGTESTGPEMRPGDNCLRCHSTTSGLTAPPWTAAGTVFRRNDADLDEGVEGAQVSITDVNGESTTVTTNRVGNFFTRARLEAPFRVAIEYEGRRIEMPIEAPAGSCNACHSWPDPIAGAPGRIYVP
jgi:hypothetical protein